MKKLVLVVAMVLGLSVCGWAGSTAWTGTVSDSRCGTKHSTPGATACVSNCVKGGAKYVLVSEGKVYELDAQDKFAEFAGKSVKVTGKLNGMAIQVESVEAAM